MDTENNEKIVLVGGGHGTAALIKHLKTVRSNITAVVTVADGGGSSQILRLTRKVPAVGDLRNVMSALIPDSEVELRAILNYRFSSKKGSFLNKHALGNLILVACLEMYKGDLHHAIQTTMRLFRAGHAMLPVTTDNIILCARLNDGSVIEGEGSIDTRPITDRRNIIDVFLKPTAHIFPHTKQAILEADKVILCAGSFWTSLMPNLVVEGLQEALQKTKAKIIYVVNIMTNHNETPGWSASDHAKRVFKYIGRTLDVVICNDGPISENEVFRYFNEESTVVDNDEENLSAYTHEIIKGDFVDDSKKIRHSRLLADTIASL